MQYTLIYLVPIQLLSLFGERDVYNVTICQSLCGNENMTRPKLLVLSKCCQAVKLLAKLQTLIEN